MAESMPAPAKISPRNPVCRLCGDSHDSRHMQRTQSMDNMSFDQSSEYAVKRCVQVWPSSLQPSKRVSKNLLCESSCVASANELSKRITPKRSAKQLSFSTPQVATVLTPSSIGDNCTITSVDQAKRTTSIFAEQPSFSTPQDATIIATSTGHDCAATSMNQPSRPTTPSSEGKPSLESDFSLKTSKPQNFS